MSTCTLQSLYINTWFKISHSRERRAENHMFACTVTGLALLGMFTDWQVVCCYMAVLSMKFKTRISISTKYKYFKYLMDPSICLADCLSDGQHVFINVFSTILRNQRYCVIMSMILCNQIQRALASVDFC